MVGGILSANGVVEYVGETTFGAFPPNPAMQWIGIVDEFSWKMKPIEEALRGLRSTTDGKRNLPTVKTKVGEEALDISLKYAMQDFAFFKYAFSNTGGNAQTDDLKSLSFGLKEPVNAKYAKLVGNVIKSHSIECAVNGSAKGDVSIVGADIIRTANDPWSGTDYIGTGSHATENSSAPKKFSDITSIQYNGADLKDALNKFKIIVDNELAVLPGFGSTLNTKIDSIVAGKRNIQVELNLDMDGIDFETDVLGYTNASLVINWGGAGNIITISGVTFPELERKWKHGDHLAATIKSENCTDLAFS